MVVPSHALWPPYLSRQTRLRRGGLVGHVSPLRSSWFHKLGSRRYYPDTNKVDRYQTVLIDSNKQVTREMSLDLRLIVNVILMLQIYLQALRQSSRYEPFPIFESFDTPVQLRRGRRAAVSSPYYQVRQWDRRGGLLPRQQASTTRHSTPVYCLLFDRTTSVAARPGLIPVTTEILVTRLKTAGNTRAVRTGGRNTCGSGNLSVFLHWPHNWQEQESGRRSEHDRQEENERLGSGNFVVVRGGTFYRDEGPRYRPNRLYPTLFSL